MRRLPIYFLIDISKNVDSTISVVAKDMINKVISHLKQDPYAIEMVWMSISVFARNVKNIVPLTPIEQFLNKEWEFDIKVSDEVADVYNVKCWLRQTICEYTKHTLFTKGDFSPIIYAISNCNMESHMIIDNWRLNYEHLIEEAFMNSDKHADLRLTHCEYLSSRFEWKQVYPKIGYDLPPAPENLTIII